MAYRFKAREQAGAGSKRIAAELITDAIDALERADQGEDIAANVLQARKDSKKLRGLIRIVEPDLGKEFAKADRSYHRIAKTIAGSRDAQALLVAFDRYPVQLGDEAVRTELRARLAASIATVHEDDVFRSAIDLLERSRDRIERWSIAEDGWAPLGRGLATTHGRGREAFRRASQKPTVNRFHDLRTEVKYGWYQLRLVRRASPSLLGPLVGTYDALGKVLGDAHDAAILERWLRAQPEVAEIAASDPEVAASLDDLVANRRDLEERGRRVAARLYSESPKRFAARIGGYWEAQRVDGREVGLPGRPQLIDLDALTVAELRQLATDHSIAGRSKLRRDELVAAVRSERQNEQADRSYII